MLNIIRADIYRLIRGKSVYITFAALFALLVLIVISAQNVVVGIQMELLEKSLNGDSETLIYNGVNIARRLYTGMDNLVWFALPLIIASAGPMFSYGTVKNSIAVGTSRVKLYFAKLILSSVLCAVLMLFYMTAGVLLATIMRGYGGTPPPDYWAELFKACFSQLFLIIAINSVGIFLVFTTKRTAIVNGFFIAFCMVPLIIILLLTNLNENFIKLYDYDLLGNVKKFGYLSILPAEDIVKGFVIGAVYMIASTAAGIALFMRAEIK